MTKRIFKNIVFASFLTFLACLFLILGVLHEYFSNQLLTELRNEAEFVAQGVELNGETYLQHLSSDNRVTWVAADGTVLYDSVVPKETMENHADREEIQQAHATGQGSSSRYSQTLSKKTVNYAVLLSDNSVIRVSSAQYTVWLILFNMLQPLMAITIIVLILAIVLANALSKKLVKPINAIDLDHPDIEEDYGELSPLLHKINRQNQLIQEQMNHLRRRQEEFRIITENMAEGFLLIDRKAEILSYNHSILQLLGSGSIPDGSSVFILNRSEPFRSAVNEALAGNHSEQEVLGHGRVYHLFANPVEVDGELSGAVIVILDVTEKEKREEMRREFSANVSHELKTPLTSIYGVSELMLNGIVKPEDIPAFAKSIHDESGKLISLINDIMRLSQLDDCKMIGEKEKVDLYDSAREVMHRLEQVAEERHVSMELTGEHAIIQGIPSIISEIIYNLCDNAIKYNKENGNLQISVSDEGAHKVLRVKDSGIGIPKAHLDRIFERFYRVDKSHSRKIGSTGLGLSIVKHGAEIHNAKIAVHSEVDQGTEISVTF